MLQYPCRQSCEDIIFRSKAMKNTAWGNLITAIALGFVTLFLVINDINTWTNEANGTYVQGCVMEVDMRTGRRRSGRGYRYDIDVMYKVDGVSYSCTFENVSRWVEGQKVDLYYLGEPGGEVFLASRNPKYLWVLSALAMAFFIHRARNPGKPLFGSEVAEEIFFGDD